MLQKLEKQLFTIFCKVGVKMNYTRLLDNVFYIFVSFWSIIFTISFLIYLKGF